MNSGYVVNRLQAGASVASLWVDLVLEGAEVDEFGAFYAQWANGGMIRPADGFIDVNNQKEIAKHYGYELQRVEQYDEFEKIMANGAGMQYGILRIGNDPNNLDKGHNVNLYHNDGGWYVSDVGAQGNHGKSWTDLIKEKRDFRYFQFLNKL